MQRSTVMVLLCLVLAGASSTDIHAQGKEPAHPPISLADSMRLVRYLDTVNHASLFSLKRQRYFDSALTIKPWKAYWWQQLCMPLFKQRKYELGMPYLDSAVKYDNETHYYLEYRAFMKCIFQKSYRDAMNDFIAVRSMNGNRAVMDHPYNFYIALCYLQLNRFDSSAQLLRQCISERHDALGGDWTHHLHWYYLGITLYEQEHYMEAIACFDSAIHRYKQFSDAKYYKTVCLEHLGKDKEALALMAEAEADFKQGYTINEDNTFYELYPYQVSKFLVSSELSYLQEKAKKK